MVSIYLSNLVGLIQNIFCRTVLNYCDEYEKIPLNYFGEIFLEITSRSFDILFLKGDTFLLCINFVFGFNKK